MFIQMLPSEAGGRGGKKISNFEHFSKYNVQLFYIRYIFKYYSWLHLLKEFSPNTATLTMSKGNTPRQNMIGFGYPSGPYASHQAIFIFPLRRLSVLDGDTTRSPSFRPRPLPLFLPFSSKTLNQNSEQNFSHFRLASRFRRGWKKMEAKIERKLERILAWLQMQRRYNTNSGPLNCR